jgi:hypothetical protein
MKRNHLSKAGGILLCAGIALAPAAVADFEATGPDGRRILLKDDGTWRYLDVKGKEQPAKDKAVVAEKDAAKSKPAATGEAVLRVQRKTGEGNVCRFEVQLVNNLPYEIRSLAPSFSAHRANGVVYDSVLAAFQAIRPGDSQKQEILFRGISCQDIARLQVVGGDRCVMGELDRWDTTDGSCLQRVRVVESDMVRFDK